MDKGTPADQKDSNIPPIPLGQDLNNVAPTEPNGQNTPLIDFVPDFRIARLSGFGLAGLLLGMIVLCYPKACNTASNFHEVKYNPRIIVADALKSVTQSYLASIKYKRDSLSKYAEVLKADTTTLKKSIEADTNQIIICESYRRYYEDASASDTFTFNKLNSILHFNITPEKIGDWDSAFNDKGYQWTDSARYWVKIPDSKPVIQNSGVYAFSIDQPRSNMRFGTKYPAVGVWALLVIIFTSFCFIAASTGIYLQIKIWKLFKDKNVTSKSLFVPIKWLFIPIWVFTFLYILALLIVWRFTLNDEVMIRSLFFMKTFTISVKWIMGVGYLSGSCCLAGFIYISTVLGYFSRSIKNKVIAINTQKELVGAGAENDDPAKLKLAGLEAAKVRDHSIYDQLIGFFNTYFILSSVILSLLVLCSGALASTINSLEFVKMLTQEWGYSPVRSDFVYLYGGLHTILLLLVYIPVRMRFNEIQLPPMPVDAAAGVAGGAIPPADNSKWLQLLKNPAGQLKDMLLVASPLLTSLVQTLFELLFK